MGLAYCPSRQLFTRPAPIWRRLKSPLEPTKLAGFSTSIVFILRNKSRASISALSAGRIIVAGCSSSLLTN